MFGLMFPMAKAAVATGAASVAMDAIARAATDCVQRASGRKPAEGRHAAQSTRILLRGLVVGPLISAPFMLGTAPALDVAASATATELVLAPAWVAVVCGYEDAVSERLPLVAGAVSGVGLAAASAVYFAAGHRVPALISSLGVLSPERVLFTICLGTSSTLYAIFVATESGTLFPDSACLAATWAVTGMLASAGLLTLSYFPLLHVVVMHGRPYVAVNAAHEIGALVFFVAGASHACVTATLPAASTRVRAVRGLCAAAAVAPFVAPFVSPVSSAAAALALQMMAATALGVSMVSLDGVGVKERQPALD